MRNAVFALMVLPLFLNPFVYAASYLQIFGGQSDSEIALYNDTASLEGEKVKGTSLGAAIGYFLSNSFAVELGMTKIELEKTEIIATSPVAFTAITNGELEIIHYGFRWFLYDFFNIRYGGTKTVFEPNLKTTGTLASVISEKSKGNSNYYGFGFGYTLKKLQFFYDYTQFSGPEKTSDNIVGIRLFF